jgi:hypothetical protein
MTTAAEAQTAFAALGLTGAISAEAIENLKESLDGVTKESKEYQATMDNIAEVEKYLNSLPNYYIDESSVIANIDSLSESLGRFSSIADTTKDVIDKLSQAIDPTYNLGMYKSSMAIAMGISDRDSDDFVNAISLAASYSDSLLDANSFNSARQQRYEQLRAVNQFSEVNLDAVSQIDVLNDQLDTQNAIKEELDKLKQLITTLTATEIKTLATQRALLDEYLKQEEVA